VIDTNGCLVGMITVDDVIDVVYEEVEEDIMHLAGVPEPDFYAPIFFHESGADSMAGRHVDEHCPGIYGHFSV